MKKEENYSLWLRPAQIQIDELIKVISDLSRQDRTKPFPPHITLLSSIPADVETIKQICTQIVDQTQEFDLRLQRIEYSETYYRNFYVLAEASSALLNMYALAKELLNFEPNETYMPHLSLLYGNLNIETKKTLQRKIENIIPNKLTCTRLDLYDSNGTVSDWHLIASYDFTTAKK